MQRIANYGSFLQAYGLKSILEELGCEVEFVDYHPGKTLIPADGGVGLKRKTLKVLEVFKCGAPLVETFRFIKYKKNYASRYYTYLGIDKKMNYTPELDLLVIGSDEVFNCVQNNTNVGFSPELFGVGNNAKRVITYAASFGNTTEEKLKKYGIQDRIIDWLKQINSISVRDNNSAKIIENFLGLEKNCNLDPVLIYDFIGKCKDIPKSVRENRYIILYGYSGRFSKSECRKIRKYANSNKLKIFCIGGVQNVCDKFIDCNPFEVIAYFQHAEFIITDTFHGTILSIISHKLFVSVIREEGYGNSEKLTDLLERLELEERSIEDLNKLPDIMKNEIKYDYVDSIIYNERKKSYEYLEQQIAAVRDEE